MIRIRHENLDPIIVNTVYEEYQYQIHDGEFEFLYKLWMEPDEPLRIQQVGKGWNLHYNRIYLELETTRWTRKYSFAESPAVLMTAMSDYETEINLETITQEIEW